MEEDAVVDILKRSSYLGGQVEFKIFAALIKKSGLSYQLTKLIDGAKPVIILAPIDSAFLALKDGANAFVDLTEEQIAQFIKLHISGKVVGDKLINLVGLEYDVDSVNDTIAGIKTIGTPIEIGQIGIIPIVEFMSTPKLNELIKNRFSAEDGILRLTRDPLFKIIQLISYKDLVGLCSANMQFRQFCQKEEFNIWNYLLKRDYGFTVDKQAPYSPKEKYISMSRERFKWQKYDGAFRVGSPRNIDILIDCTDYSKKEVIEMLWDIEIYMKLKIILTKDKNLLVVNTKYPNEFISLKPVLEQPEVEKSIDLYYDHVYPEVFLWLFREKIKSIDPKVFRDENFYPKIGMIQAGAPGGEFQINQQMFNLGQRQRNVDNQNKPILLNDPPVSIKDVVTRDIFTIIFVDAKWVDERLSLTQLSLRKLFNKVSRMRVPESTSDVNERFKSIYGEMEIFQICQLLYLLLFLRDY